MSWKLQNLARGAGWAKLALLIVAGLTLANAGRAQMNFANAYTLTGGYGSVTFDNAIATPTNFPSIAGFTPNLPLWFQWTAPSDGEVEWTPSAAWTTPTGLR